VPSSARRRGPTRVNPPACEPGRPREGPCRRVGGRSDFGSRWRWRPRLYRLRSDDDCDGEVDETTSPFQLKVLPLSGGGAELSEAEGAHKSESREPGRPREGPRRRVGERSDFGSRWRWRPRLYSLRSDDDCDGEVDETTSPFQLKVLPLSGGGAELSEAEGAHKSESAGQCGHASDRKRRQQSPAQSEPWRRTLLW